MRKKCEACGQFVPRPPKGWVALPTSEKFQKGDDILHHLCPYGPLYEMVIRKVDKDLHM